MKETRITLNFFSLIFHYSAPAPKFILINFCSFILDYNNYHQIQIPFCSLIFSNSILAFGSFIKPWRKILQIRFNLKNKLNSLNSWIINWNLVKLTKYFNYKFLNQINFFFFRRRAIRICIRTPYLWFRIIRYFLMYIKIDI